MILTKIDAYYQAKLGIKKMECPTGTLFSDGYTEEAIDDFMQATQNVLSSKTRVLPTLNYTGGFMKPDEAIELLTISNLEKIKDEAINSLKSRFKNALLIFTAKSEFICFIITNSFDNTLSQIRSEVKNAIIKSRDLDDDAFSFRFINTNGQNISKKDEEKLRIRNIYFTDEIIKSITKPAIRITYGLPEESKDPVFLKDQKKPFTPPPPPPPPPSKNILLTIATLDDKKEIEIVGEVTLNDSLMSSREKMESKEKSYCCFLNREGKIIDGKTENAVKVGEIINEGGIIFVKLMVHPQVRN